MSLSVAEGQARLARGFAERGFDAPGIEARLILAHALGVAPERLTVLSRDPLTEGQMAQAELLAARRWQMREPMSHILGYRDFWKHRFTVTSAVLDPRPETEVLVAAALDLPFASVLDLGTGSGAILLSVLADRPDASGLGVDLSAAALQVAEVNRTALGLEGRAALAQSDWYSAVNQPFDLILSNPPYIAAAEMPGLAPELGHEPRIALTDEGDGLSAYRKILAGLPDHLSVGGRLLVEIGWQQGQAVADLFLSSGLKAVRILSDLEGRDRVVCGRRTR